MFEAWQFWAWYFIQTEAFDRSLPHREWLTPDSVKVLPEHAAESREFGRSTLRSMREHAESLGVHIGTMPEEVQNRAHALAMSQKARYALPRAGRVSGTNERKREHGRPGVK